MVFCTMDDLEERKSLHDDEEDKIFEMKKSCNDCKTSRTPMWRGGPAGPKSLCNACGIRYRKKRKTMLGLEEDSEKKRRKGHISTIRSSLSASSVNSINGNELGESLKMRVIVMGEKMMCGRSSIVKNRGAREEKAGRGRTGCSLFNGIVLWLSFCMKYEKRRNRMGMKLNKKPVCFACFSNFWELKRRIIP